MVHAIKAASFAALQDVHGKIVCIWPWHKLKALDKSLYVCAPVIPILLVFHFLKFKRAKMI